MEMILELTKLSNIYRLRLNVSFTTLINYFLVFLRLRSSFNLLLIIRMANDIKIKTIRWFITSHPLLASVS